MAFLKIILDTSRFDGVNSNHSKKNPKERNAHYMSILIFTTPDAVGFLLSRSAPVDRT